jgi:predicted dinucleotide-binding enzyme
VSAPIAHSIAIIGAGNIGGTLGRAWLAAGHRVTYGLRPDSGRDGLPEGAARSGLVEAVKSAGIVVFAVPGGAMPEVLADVGPHLEGRIVIDATNDVRGAVLHDATLDARRAAGLAVYRGFSTLGWEVFARPRFGDVVADLVFSGPDGPGRAAMEGLVRDVGLEPVWLGDGQAAVVDGATRLWFALVMGTGRPRRTALKVIGG